MNQVQEESKNRLLRAMAVLGFLAIIIIATWLAVQVVRLIPSAFSSLASLAESVEEGRKAQNDIVLESDDGVVNSSEAFSLSWSPVNRPGSYAFMYDCADGVAVNLRVAGEIISVSCGEAFTLPKDTYEADVLFTSERNRFSEVTYRILFTRESEDEPFIKAEKLVTVVNASIPQGVVLGEADAEMSGESDDMEDGAGQLVVTTPPTTSVSTPAPVPQEPRYRVTYKQPVSNPNGYTDLAVSMVAVGKISGSNFNATDELEAGKTGAIQFKVKNIGTKTSTGWDFEVALPGGADYNPSKTQEPLKPNEHAIFTVVFNVPDDEDENELRIVVGGGGDSKANNNTIDIEVVIND